MEKNKFFAATNDEGKKEDKSFMAIGFSVFLLAANSVSVPGYLSVIIDTKILIANDGSMTQETGQATSLYNTISFGCKINCSYIF